MTFLSMICLSLCISVILLLSISIGFGIYLSICLNISPGRHNHAHPVEAKFSAEVMQNHANNAHLNVPWAKVKIKNYSGTGPRVFYL